MTFIKKSFELEFSDIHLDCDYCDMNSNCTHTYSECRSYNKNLWSTIDKQLNKIRKNIFTNLVKEYD